MNDDSPKVYLCGPIQHSSDGGHGWRNTVMDEYPDRFDWLNPLDEFDGGEDTATILPESLAEDYEADEEEEVITDSEVVETDKELIQSADAVLIGFMEKVPTWGSPFEQAIASGLPNHSPKPIALWHGNIPFEDLSPWIRYHSSFVSQRMIENIWYLESALEASQLCLDCHRRSRDDLSGFKFEVVDGMCDRCKRNTAVSQSGMF